MVGSAVSRWFVDRFLEVLRRLCKLTSHCSMSSPVGRVGGRLHAWVMFRACLSALSRSLRAASRSACLMWVLTAAYENNMGGLGEQAKQKSIGQYRLFMLHAYIRPQWSLVQTRSHTGLWWDFIDFNEGLNSSGGRSPLPSHTRWFQSVIRVSALPWHRHGDLGGSW